MPARAAARILSFTPPTGSTLPRSVISPVMAMSRCTGILVTAESSAVAMVMPADGPSFGIAPSGTWMWMSSVAWKSGSSPNSSARERTYDSAARADSCITSPSLPVSVSVALAARERDFGRQDLAADFRPGQTGGQTDLALVVDLLRAELGLAEELADFGAVDGDRRSPDLPSRTCRATLRSTEPISRSRLRTPASRV